VTKFRGGDVFVPMIRISLPMAITGGLPMTVKKSLEIVD